MSVYGWMLCMFGGAPRNGATSCTFPRRTATSRISPCRASPTRRLSGSEKQIIAAAAVGARAARAASARARRPSSAARCARRRLGRPLGRRRSANAGKTFGS